LPKAAGRDGGLRADRPRKRVLLGTAKLLASSRRALRPADHRITGDAYAVATRPPRDRPQTPAAPAACSSNPRETYQGFWGFVPNPCFLGRATEDSTSGLRLGRPATGAQNGEKTSCWVPSSAKPVCKSPSYLRWLTEPFPP
jgi:hypothetical protein